MANYWNILIKRKFILITSVVLLVLFSAAYSIWKAYPPLYSSTCSIKFEKELTLGGLFSQVFPWSGANNLETQESIITGYDLITEVAQKLSLLKQTITVNDPLAAAVVEDLKAKVYVENEKNTNIFYITITDRDPAFAQNMANELAEAYSRRNSEKQQKQLNEALKYIDDQLLTTRKDLQKSEAEFNGYSQDNQLISIDLQSENLLLRKNEIEEKIRGETNTVRLNELRRGLQELDLKINSLMEKKFVFNRLKREIDSLRTMTSYLEEKKQEAMIKRAEKPNEVEIIKRAQLSSTPVIPLKIWETILAGMLTGIVIGLILVFVSEIFLNSAGFIEEIEKTLDVKIIGVIPRIDIKSLITGMKSEQEKVTVLSSPDRTLTMITHFAPEAIISESLRSLGANIQFIRENQKIKTLAVTSSCPREGKSIISANLAITLSQAGLKTLLVDSDVRNPVLSKIFTIENNPGLSDILLGTCAWQDAVKTVTDMIIGGLSMNDVMMTPGLDNLNIITRGMLPKNPSELIISQKFIEFLGEVEKEYDIIILDSSSLISTANATFLGTQVDGVLIVNRPEIVSKKILKRTTAQLKQVNCKLMGIVLNCVKLNWIPETLRDKYSSYDLSGNQTQPVDKKIKQENGEKTNRRIKVLLPLTAILLLVAGIWWQKNLLFPERYPSSKIGVIKDSGPTAKVQPDQKDISPEVKSGEEKISESSSNVEVPKVEETEPLRINSVNTADKPDSVPKEVKPEYPEGRYPYSVYLGSFNSTDQARRALDNYLKAGITSFWVKVNLGEKGIWYRVYTGEFPDKESAGAYINEKLIMDGEIKKTAYAVYAGSFTEREGLEGMINILKENEYSPYIIADENFDNLIAGAFVTKEGAEELSAELTTLGISNSVVLR